MLAQVSKKSLHVGTGEQKELSNLAYMLAQVSKKSLHVGTGEQKELSNLAYMLAQVSKSKDSLFKDTDSPLLQQACPQIAQVRSPLCPRKMKNARHVHHHQIVRFPATLAQDMSSDLGQDNHQASSQQQQQGFSFDTESPKRARSQEW
jgi:hypothetical protein